MEDLKTSFSSTNFPRARERISSKFIDGLGTHTQKYSHPYYKLSVVLFRERFLEMYS